LPLPQPGEPAITRNGERVELRGLRKRRGTKTRHMGQKKTKRKMRGGVCVQAKADASRRHVTTGYGGPWGRPSSGSLAVARGPTT